MTVEECSCEFEEVSGGDIVRFGTPHRPSGDPLVGILSSDKKTFRWMYYTEWSGHQTSGAEVYNSPDYGWDLCTVDSNGEEYHFYGHLTHPVTLDGCAICAKHLSDAKEGGYIPPSIHDREETMMWHVCRGCFIHICEIRIPIAMRVLIDK